MKGLLLVDDVLRARPWLVRGNNHIRWLLIVATIMLVFGALYGAVMGSYSGARYQQILYSALKVPLLLAATFALSLPSFFVLNTLFGLRDDFAASIRALATTQAGLTIVLVSFAPFTALWYVSFGGYDSAKMTIASILPPINPKQPAPPNHDVDMAHHLRLRRHPDGLDSASIYWRSRRANHILPHRGVG